MKKQELSTGDKKMDAFYAEARRRVAFRIHLTVYVLVNLFIWTLWLLLCNDGSGLQDAKFKAILAITICWLIAVVFHYLVVFKWRDKMVTDEVAQLIKAYEAELREGGAEQKETTSVPEVEEDKKENTITPQ